MNILEKNVTELKGVGAKKAQLLEKLGILTVGDVINHFPRAYQDRGHIKTVAEVKSNIAGKIAEQALISSQNPDDIDTVKTKIYSDPCAMMLTIGSEPAVVSLRNGMKMVRFKAFDDTGTVDISYFNASYIRDLMHVGTKYRFYGKCSPYGQRLQCSNPIFEACPDGDVSKLRNVVPVYPVCQGINQKAISQLVNQALYVADSELSEYLPSDVLIDTEMPSYAYTVKTMHNPASMDDLSLACRRRTFEELYLLFVAMTVSGNHKKLENTHVMKNTDICDFENALPFEFTNAQKRCVNEIAGDMSGVNTMNRILTGDVGSGKTAVAAASLYIAVKNGYRGAVMVPTEILASQHYSDMAKLFAPLGITCALLTGSTPKKEKDRILRIIDDSSNEINFEDGSGRNTIDIIIGTHALLSEKVNISNLGIAVIDEQHRFGVAQRAALLEKCRGIHNLVMSATPIPRTLTLAMYGSLDVSRIDELPKGRQKVDTFIVGESYRERLNAFITKQVNEGHQVYIVCPAVDMDSAKKLSAKDEDAENMADVTFDIPKETDLPPMKAAETYTEELKTALPDINIAFVHGKMKNADKDRVMAEFTMNRIQVLVSTTVIEVGVNVPNATLMIVENAERFGLSQLHQLRGRVGRGSAKSYFILVSDAKGETAVQRLKAIKSTSDGYRIAEYDLELRGPGDFIGNDVTRQHGEMKLRLAAMCRDKELIQKAADAAKRTTDSDPDLTMPEHRGLNIHVRGLLRESSATAN